MGMLKRMGVGIKSEPIPIEISRPELLSNSYHGTQAWPATTGYRGPL